MTVNLLLSMLPELLDVFYNFVKFFINTDIAYSDFSSFFQMMATLSLPGVIALKAGASPFLNFLYAQYRDEIIKGTEEYNRRLEVLRTNLKVFGKECPHKSVDIEKLKNDNDSYLRSDARVFSNKCIVTFFYCFVFLIVAPLANNYASIYFFLFCLTLLLFVYSILLPIRLKSIMFKKLMLHIAIVTIFSFLACFFTKDIHNVFKYNVFFLYYIVFSVWSFISQFYFMTYTMPQNMLKRNDDKLRKLNEVIEASNVVIEYVDTDITPE